MSIFVTRNIPVAGLQILQQAKVAYQVGQENEELGLPPQELQQALQNCQTLLCLLTETLDAQTLQAAGPQLRGIANMAVGYDNIDVAAATELGIPVSNTPGVLTESTADLTWALLLATARWIPQAESYLRQGRFQIWGPRSFLGCDVGPGPENQRKTLGIVGYGRIGQAVAWRSLGFDMQVLAYDPHNRKVIHEDALVQFAELDELLTRSDFVSLHCPANESTHHLIGTAELARMKETAILINTSRGPLVDEAALVQALQTGQIAGAGLDVFEDEPRLAPGLLDLNNVVCLPHIGSATLATRGHMASTAALNALAHLRGDEAPNVVNPEVYSTAAYQKRLRP